MLEQEKAVLILDRYIELAGLKPAGTLHITSILVNTLDVDVRGTDGEYIDQFLVRIIDMGPSYEVSILPHYSVSISASYPALGWTDGYEIDVDSIEEYAYEVLSNHFVRHTNIKKSDIPPTLYDLIVEQLEEHQIDRDETAEEYQEELIHWLAYTFLVPMFDDQTTKYKTHMMIAGSDTVRFEDVLEHIYNHLDMFDTRDEQEEELADIIEQINTFLN